MISLSELGYLVVAVGLLQACAAPQDKEAPLRSPTRDYPHPPPTTSDGEVVGAEGKTPADRLAEGPTNEGPAPGWKADEKGIRYDSRRAAGATDYEAGSDEKKSDKDSEATGGDKHPEPKPEQ